MNDLNHFRKIADEELKDLHMTPELMKKTLKQCQLKRKPPYRNLLVTAACLAVIAGTVHFYGVYQKSIQIEPFETIPKSTTQLEETKKVVVISSLKEAKERFGDAFLSPSVIPESYFLHEIDMSDEAKPSAKLVLIYSNIDDRSFLITEQRTDAVKESRKAEEVSVDGSVWYKIETDNMQTTEYTHFANGVQYTISGLLSEDETILIIKSLK